MAPRDGSGALERVAAGVLAWVQPDGTWWVNNAGAVVDGDRTLVVDTCATAARTQRFLDALAAAAGRPDVTLAVNTHQHGDHTYGNSLLPASTVLVGHELMRAGLAADPIIDGCPPFWSPVPDWGDVRRRLPDVTVTDRLTVHLPSGPVELVHPGGPAHTPGDLMVWLAGPRVLFSGDLLFHGLTPLAFMGSLPGADAALDRIEALAPEHVVPGHGPVAHGDEIAAALAAHRAYYRFVLATAEDGLARGLAPLEAARRCALGPFADWADAERIVLNLHRAYADLGGGQLDLVAALADAVAWRGGPMPTHV